MRKIDIVIKTVLDRWPGSELRFRPELQDRRCQYVCRRMAQTLDVRHRRALFGCFSIFSHGVLLGPNVHYFVVCDEFGNGRSLPFWQAWAAGNCRPRLPILRRNASAW